MKTSIRLFALLALLGAGYGWVAATPARADHEDDEPRRVLGRRTDGVAMPDLRGVHAVEAVSRLEEMGYGCELVSVTGVPLRMVGGQSPAPGMPLFASTEIRLEIGMDPLIETIVPDLTGMRYRRVQERLDQVYVVMIEPVLVRGRGRGRVIASTPAAGQHLPIGGVLTVQVGARGLEVPELLGQRLQDAIGSAERAGFSLRAAGGGWRFMGPRGGLMGGVVIAQEPHAGDFALPGTEIQVTLGVRGGLGRRPGHGDHDHDHDRPGPVRPGGEVPGAGEVVVPGLVGLERESAERVILALGLRGRLQAAGSAGANARVISQSPAPGQVLPRGGLVTLVLSDRDFGGGAPPAEEVPPGYVRVPEVIGESVSRALLAMRQAGLSTYVSATGPLNGRVVSSSPAAGTVVRVGTRVRIDLGRTPPPQSGSLAMINVVGQTREVALQALRWRGFEVELLGPRANSPGARVSSQYPPPGTRMQPGSRVRLVFD